MTMTRDEAWAHLCEWTETDSLRKHARAVELVMRHAASHYGDAADVEAWGIAGMLHDADYEKWPAEHPNKIVARLRELGEERIAHAISAHYTKWGVPYDTLLSKALIAADELTGFTVACCLVRPDGIISLLPKSVKKRFKQRAFAAKVEREEIEKALAIYGVELGDQVTTIIAALTPFAAELELAGQGAVSTGNEAGETAGS